MSLSSAQAAIIAKTAAISDVEFKASQITTQRLEYSQTTATIYQRLSNMDVPTPPQQADFNRIEYRFIQGITPTTIGNVRPGEGGRFNVELKQQVTGYVMQEFGSVSVSGHDNIRYANVNDGERQVYSLREANDQNYITDTELARYVEAYQHAHPDEADRPADEIIDSLCVYFANAVPGDNSAVYFLSSDQVAGVQFDDNGNANSQWLNRSEVIPNGSYTESTWQDGCNLTFDGSNGRILTIEIPAENGSGTRRYDLEAIETTDTDAYNAAFNDYEYEQHLYEQEQAKLNAQLEDIQYEDKKLEVELQGLQTQRSAMQKELESLQKVRDDGIESGFKGFA